MKYERVPFHR